MYVSLAKVLLVHAGGYSQRLPNFSVLGKIFMALPCGDPMLDMFDALLVMYIDLPERMHPGVSCQYVSLHVRLGCTVFSVGRW